MTHLVKGEAMFGYSTTECAVSRTATYSMEFPTITGIPRNVG